MHCKNVCFHEVEYPLDEEILCQKLSDWTAYTRAEYIVFTNGTQYATARVEMEKGTELFKKVVSFEIISLPEETDFVDDPSLDVLNIPSLARIQLEHQGRAVVIKGMFSHVIFIKDLKPLYLNVVDNTPPRPSKLGVLVQKALDSDFIDLPIVPVIIDIEMEDRIPDVSTTNVIMPCKVSGTVSEKSVFFLDQNPGYDEDSTLIGCNLSKRIYQSLYGKEPIYIDTCPADFAEGRGKTITKCCKVKDGHKLEGDVATVPWGATVPEVVEAILDLFKDELSKV